MKAIKHFWREIIILSMQVMAFKLKSFREALHYHHYTLQTPATHENA